MSVPSPVPSHLLANFRQTLAWLGTRRAALVDADGGPPHAATPPETAPAGASR